MPKIKQLKSPHPFAANTYLISLGDEYAIVDPTAPWNADYQSINLKYILLTHAHFDHILEIESWKSALFHYLGATLLNRLLIL